MYIQSITLTNFRCFGSEPTKITFGSEVTVLIGSNGAGKSATIDALRRLFGISREERTLTKSDVHFGPNESPAGVAQRQIVIDVVFSFPELRPGSRDEGAETVPDIFKAMTVAEPGGALKARLRLEALWTGGETFADEVPSVLYWVTTLDDVEFGDTGAAALDKQRVRHADRGKIQILYMPATRDGPAVTRQALRQLLRRLERSGDFSATIEDDIKELSISLQNTVSGLPAVEWITNQLSVNWTRLHGSHHLATPRLVVISQEFTQLLRTLVAKLSPSPDGRERSIEELSEGQTSLFFLALAATVAQLENELTKSPPLPGFLPLDVNPPALTIFSVEEPENHLAPFYLSRLMNLLTELCAGPKAMAIVTSHAPGVVRRVGPGSIRHLRLDPTSLSTRANRIRIPRENPEDAKYVREAVLAQPEIYFAQLVVLGEGDSEHVVLPRIAKALGVDLDHSFVAFAPLGGRHVNHFWRLLNELDIPFLTLLDLDLGRFGGGPLRFKYAYDQRLAIGRSATPRTATGNLQQTTYWRGLRRTGMRTWRGWLEARDVFYSYPLDLDMMMLRSFPDAYGLTSMDEPDDVRGLQGSVFGKKGKGLAAYTGKVSESDRPSPLELFAYDALFKKRDKPGSHIAALSKLDNGTIREHCPVPLRGLIERAGEILAARARLPGSM